jgi:alcohol dehydrogenase class IV
LDVTLINENDEKAAEANCGAVEGFLKRIGLWIDFKSLNVSKEEIRIIADHGQVLGDYKNNPRIASIQEMYDMLIRCYER